MIKKIVIILVLLVGGLLLWSNIHRDTNLTNKTSEEAISYAVIIYADATTIESDEEKDLYYFDSTFEEILEKKFGNSTAYDGTEYGLANNEITFFFYTEKPDELIEALTPVLESEILFENAKLVNKEEGTNTGIRNQIINPKYNYTQ